MNAPLRNALVLLAAVPVCSHAAPSMSVVGDPAPTEITSGSNMTIPLTSWPVDTKSFIAQHKASVKGGNLKAATDRATVYRPVKVCRLVDTRGGPAFINIPGPLAAGSITNVNSSGVCGIPAGTGVAGISISFHVLNHTPNNGGTIAFLQQGAPLNGVNAVFNPGADWTAATANVSLPDDSGNFEISITNSTVDVVVDVNGYYQDLDFVDTGTQELNINGTVAAGGTVFEVTNTGAGTALSASNLGGGIAFNMTAGAFNMAGGGINSGTAAFILEANTSGSFGSGGNICGGQPSIVVIDNPMLNNQSGAIVFVTPRENAPTSVAGNGPLLSGHYSAFYVGAAACSPSAAGHWAVRETSGAAIPDHGQFSVFFMTTN